MLKEPRTKIAELDSKQVKVLKSLVQCDSFSQIVHTFITELVHAKTEHFEVLVLGKCSRETLDISSLESGT